MKRLSIIGIVLFAVTFAHGMFYILDLNYTDNHEVGLTWNPFVGQTGIQPIPGWHITPPWLFETSVDTWPERVCVTSATQAVNCRLVQFVPDQYKTFLQTQGFGYYWWANRISFNFGYHEEYRGMRDIMRGYAYSDKPYPFIKIISTF